MGVACFIYSLLLKNILLYVTNTEQQNNFYSFTHSLQYISHELPNTEFLKGFQLQNVDNITVS